MPDFITQLSSFAVFIGIGSLGFLFLLVSLVFGEIFEGHDLDHDLDHGPSFFSTRILSVFVTAFGGFGAIATQYGLSVLPASGVGFAGGLVFASLIYYFAQFLYGQQATTQLQTGDVVGMTARVIVSIPANGVGQVRCRVGEEMVDRIAKGKGGMTIAENTVVRIEESLGEMVVVRPE
ncbi:MAG: hypothetical protein JJE04_12665 [Acidobacteriia bacterium]|nr:hypothetical protein [Terriglobia bacterium]